MTTFIKNNPLINNKFINAPTTCGIQSLGYMQLYASVHSCPNTHL